MPITYVGATTKVGKTNSDRRWYINKPAATVYKDVLIGVVHAHANYSIYPPAGWKEIVSVTSANGTRVAYWYKVATAAEPKEYYWRTGYTGGTMLGSLAILSFRGASNADPINATKTAASTAASLSSGNIVTTGANQTMLVGASATYVATGTVPTSTCGTLTERTDTGASDVPSGPFSRGLATYTSGMVSAGTYAHTFVSSASANHGVLLIALNEAVGPDNETPISDTTGPAFKVSNKFHRAMYRSHQVVSYVEAKAPNGEKTNLTITDGSVDIDRSGENRRRLTIQCVDKTGKLTPSNVAGLLTPYGTELRPYRGIRFSDTGATEYAPLGVFRIQKVGIKDEAGSLVMDIEATDLSRTIARDVFTAPYTVAKGTTLTKAITDICSRTFPDMTYNISSTSRTIDTAVVHDIGANPWEALVKMASTLGYDIYFDVLGRLTILPPPDISNLPAPEFTYIEGKNCLLLSLEKTLTDEAGYNGVVIVGEAAGDDKPSVTGVAWDDDPKSVTYRKGPYGEVPLVVQDQIVKTAAEATDAAKAKLKTILGFTSQVGIEAVPNPLLEVGNIVKIERAASKVNDLYVVDAFNVPLALGGTQSLTLRQKLSTEDIDGG